MSDKYNWFNRYRLIWLVSFLGASFYVLDSFIDSTLLGKGDFFGQLLQPEPYELWWRSSIFFISLVFGFYAQYLLNRAETSSKQARTAEKFLDSIIENTPFMIFIKDASELRFIRVNKEAEILTGYSREALIGKNDFDFFPEDQAAFFTNMDRQVMQSNTPLDIPEEDIETRNCGKRTLHTRKVPIEGDNGKPEYLLGISEDITDMLNARRALVEEKNLAELYLHISEAMIVGLNREGTITRINRRACEILGRTEDELIGKNWFDTALPQENRDHIKKVFKKIVSNELEQTEYYENEIVTSGGEARCIVWHNTLQKTSVGEIIGTLSSGIDITRRKAMEDELNLAGAVYESTNQAVVVTDKNKKIISINPAYTTITGYQHEEVVGINPSHIKSGHHDDVFYQELWNEVEKTGQWKGEIWDRRKNGEAFPSWQSISSIMNDDGELTHYVSVFSDITPIKQYQDDLDFLAHHDPLTGLPNRLMFNDRVEHALQRCLREKTKLALMFLDLNGFKEINDNHGHNVGDQALQVTARRLELLLRKEDTVARFGGDEFLILLESYESREGLERVANKIIKDVTSPMKIDGCEIVTGISIGMAIGPDDEQYGESLIGIADQAMYRAKSRGSNTYSY